MAAGNRRFNGSKGNTTLIGKLTAEVDNVIVFVKKVSVVSHPVIVLIDQVIHAAEVKNITDGAHTVEQFSDTVDE